MCGLTDRSQQAVQQIAGALFELADVTTDIIIFVQWALIGQGWLSVIGFIFFQLSNTVSSLLIFANDAQCSLCGCIGLTSLYQIFHAIDSYKDETYNPSDDTTYYIFKSIQIFQSIPSTALQIFILIGKSLSIPTIISAFTQNGRSGNPTPLEIVSVSLSFLFTVYAAPKFAVGWFTVVHRGKPTEPTSEEIWNEIVMYVWVLCELFHRTVSLFLLWFTFGEFRFFWIPLLGVPYMVMCYYVDDSPSWESTSVALMGLTGILSPVPVTECVTLFGRMDLDIVNAERYGVVYRFIMVRQLSSVGVVVMSLFMVNTRGVYTIPETSIGLFRVWVGLVIGFALVSFVLTFVLFGMRRYNWCAVKEGREEVEASD